MRKTTVEDITRFAENLYDFSPGMVDLEDYEIAYDEYMEDETTMSKKALFKPGFAYLASKGLVQEEKITEAYKIKRKRKRMPKRLKEKDGYKKFIYSGRIKDKIVIARKVKYKIREKAVIRYIDKRGRFVSVKKEKGLAVIRQKSK